MAKRLRSQEWFDNPDNPGMTALYLERYLNFGLTRHELQSGKPIVGIAQTGSDLAPCNRVHVKLAERIRAGIRDAGGIPLEFPIHPIQETGKRPTANIDRNLAYLSLVEVLYGYPIDGVVLCTGCDKTAPACLMAAATMDLPAIALNSGPMLDGWYKGKLAGSGMVVWEARRMLGAGEITWDEFMDMTCASAPSDGHCNTMGTALSMNSMVEALGMCLPGNAAIPAPYRERGQMAYETGRRAVAMVHEDLKPSAIMTRAAFENAIVACSAIGGSSNCQVHVNAIARHMGVELDVRDWEKFGRQVPLLVNCQPAGEYLGEGFHRAGGVPAVLGELIRAGRIDEAALTANGKTMGENCRDVVAGDRRVIKSYDAPLMAEAGFVVLSGNLFDAGIMKTSVVSDDFRRRFLADPAHPNCFEGRAVVFEGPEDYHHRINDPDLGIDAHCVLVVRNVGPVGYPGAPEVVNMQPPDHLLKQGIKTLPTIGDGRQSGTSDSPSILNCSPESAIGGGLALLQTGDMIRIDLVKNRADALVPEAEWQARRKAWQKPALENHTPWQEFYRTHVQQLAEGGCLDFATRYHRVGEIVPRDNH
jgi:dihydroxy-acid dehydratase